MSGRERPIVTNPKDNNRWLLVTAKGQSGKTVRLALLRPGESFRPEKMAFSVEERHPPVTLTMRRAAPGEPFETAPAGG